jgi:translocation and assembly module TamB
VDAGARNRHVHIATDAPAILTLNHSVINVQHFKLADGKSYIQAQGGLSLKDSDNPLALKLQGNTDLSILENADRDFYSSGNAILDATIHGSLSKPLVNGKVELQNAAVNYADVSNGLSKGNGIILLNGSNATIQNLTGESGGGKISVTGFAGLAPNSVVFNLHATANKVRTRYADASVTSNADISLAGNDQRSTLSGTVTIQRISYSTSSDVGSFLSSASAPPSTPSAPSPFLSGMRLDLRVVTATDMRVVSTYSDKLALTSSLNITGTAQDPGILGRVNVTNGDLVFFGNTYTVNNGSINFYNANSIQPILDLSLETTAQGVDVTLGVSGPVNDLKLSYRSDPPLSFEQIVQLLATNTTPNDPTIAAHQPTPPQQSASQMGESAVLGQAVANPLASRVQRVFGLTQFKIDPSVSGSNGQPSARVTLQQKITSNLTFTYITDVTQTNSEIIRVTLDITPKVAAVALRDYNGNVSVELFYKFQKR